MITVKDIREKEFSQQKRGYHEDEVDEFLDEIADQMEALIRENKSLIKKLEEIQQDKENILFEPEQQPAAEPAHAESNSVMQDDSSYFRNLEITLRETLLSAQRITDKTVSEAKAKAEITLQEAAEKADIIKRDAVSESASLRSSLAQDTQDAQLKLEGLRAAITDHKKKFRDLLKAQMEALGQDDDA